MSIEARGRYLARVTDRSKRRALVAVVGSLILVAAACGSSKPSSSATTTGSATTAAGGSTASTTAGGSTATTAGGKAGPPIVVGGIGSIQAAGAAGMDTGFKARITRFNNAGGINGRKISFLGVQDDGASPTKALSIVQSQVEQQHVFAVAPILSLGFNGSQFAFLQQNKVPGIGWAVTSDWCQNPYALGNTGCLDGTHVTTTSDEAVIQYAKYKNIPISSIKLAVFGNALPGSVTTVQNHAQAFASLGAKIVYAKAPIPAGGVTDYTPYADAIISAKPTLVISYTDVADSIGVFAAMKTAGFTGDIMNGTGEIPGLFQSPSESAAFNGAYSYSVDFPVQEEGSPVIKQEQADLAAIGQPTTLNLGISVGWFTADFFIQALQATVKAGDALTPAGLDAAVNAGFSYSSLAGGPQNVAFPAAENTVLDCDSLVKVDSNTKTYIVAGPYTCKAPAVLKGS